MFSYFSHERKGFFTFNAPHPDKIALTNGVNKSKFALFQILRIFKVPQTLVNQQETAKVLRGILGESEAKLEINF